MIQIDTAQESYEKTKLNEDEIKGIWEKIKEARAKGITTISLVCVSELAIEFLKSRGYYIFYGEEVSLSWHVANGNDEDAAISEGLLNAIHKD